MYRQRFQSLLATSSVTALMLGVAAEAWAGCVTVNGGTSGPVSNSAAISCILIENNASVSGSVINTPTGTIIPGAGTRTGLLISNSTVTGSVVNQGSISAPAQSDAGIGIINNATVSGGIANSGTISAGSVGIVAVSGNISGGITNSGTISAGFVGILALGTLNVSISNFSGGITNSGAISAQALGIVAAGISTFAGGITNTGRITVPETGILVARVSNFTGGITNTGTITATGAGFPFAAGITVDAVSNFSGGISNSSTITTAGTGIFAAAVSTFSGGVSNSGLIAGKIGIGLGLGTTFTVGRVSTFSGGIVNSGSILASAVGIQLGGRIGAGTSAQSGVSVLQGGITNTGTISAGSIGILALNTPALSVFDSGTIIGGSGTAIQFAGGTNTMTLGPGWSITGLVKGAGADIFQLGGAGTGTFNLGQLGTQFTGFTIFNVLGGTWELSGSDAGFTGATTISGGDLVVGTAAAPNVVLGGPVTLQNGGELSGHGTILGSVTNLSGTVLPGGSIGTLTITGNYTQGAGGTLLTQVSSTAASVLAAGGRASLNGTLAVSFLNRPVPFSRFTILTAGGGVSGTFAQLVEPEPVIPATAVFLPNEVDLVLGGFAGQTRNEAAVAGALNQGFAGASGDFATALATAVFLPPAQMRQTLSSLGGQIYGNLAEVSLQDRRLFLGAMDERMRALGGGGSPGGAVLGGLAPGWGNSGNALQLAALGAALGGQNTQTAQTTGSAAPGPALPDNIWVRGFGQFGSLGSNGGALGAGYSTGGGAIGAELYRTPEALFGIAAGGGQSTVSLNTNPESGTISFVQFGGYGAYALGWGAALDGAAIYARNTYSVSRGLVNLGRSATSNHGGDDAVLDLGLSRPLAADGWQITPRAGFSYFHIGQSPFTETHADSLDLIVDPGALDALRSKVGVSVARPLTLGDSQVLSELRAAWTHDFLDNRGAFAAAFSGAPAVTFSQIGAAAGRDAAELGAGVSFAIAQTSIPGQLSAFVQYDVTIAAHQLDNAVAAGLKLTW